MWIQPCLIVHNFTIALQENIHQYLCASCNTVHSITIALQEKTQQYICLRVVIQYTVLQLLKVENPRVFVCELPDICL